MISGGQPDNRITSVNINGFEDHVGVDDVLITLINFRPVAVPGGPSGGYTAPQGTPVAFAGTASFDPVDASGLKHPQGDAVTYHWDFGHGSATATDSTAQYTYVSDGIYTATLTVTDPNGLSHAQTVPVTITNVAPVIAARDTTIFAGTPLQLPITLTDPGILDGPWSYSIDWGDDSPVVNGSINTWAATMAPSVGDRTHTYAGNGSYTVTITASDAKGGTRTETRTVTIPNRPPVAAFASGPTAGPEGTPQTYVAGSVDPDSDPLTHSWIVRLQSSVNVLASGAGSSFAYTFPDNGTYLVELTANDGVTTHSAVRTVTVSNVAPTADFAAPATATVGQSFSISFSNPADAGTSDGPFQYAYDCGSGFGAVAGAVSASCTPAAAGTLTVKGKVVDKDGGSTEYTATVEVVPSNSAPVPGTISGPATGNEGQSLSYSAHGWTDPDPGQTLSYTWTFQKVGGGGWTTTANGSAVNVVVPDDGQYQITLTATDGGPNGGLSATISKVVTIANVAPTAALVVPTGGVAGTAFAISLENVEDPGVNDSFSFNFTCGGGAPASQSGASATCLPTTQGAYAVTGTVSDGDGGTRTYNATVPVILPNQAPVAGAITVTTTGTPEGSSYGFQANGWSDPDGDPLTYSWSFSGPSTVAAGAGATVSRTILVSGTYTVTLVTSDGKTGTTTSTQFTVAPAPPVVNAGANVSLTSGDVFNLAATFADLDPTDGPWQWEIDWGNGESTTGSSNSQQGTIVSAHQYFAAGTYDVTVRVRDGDGQVGTDMVSVTVSRVAATISITPRTVKLRGNGDLTITARVTSSAGINPRELDPADVRLTSNPATSSGAPVAQRNNGSYMHVANPAHAQFQFSLQELMFAETIPTGRPVRLYLIGTLPDGREFAGYDEVSVLPQ